MHAWQRRHAAVCHRPDAVPVGAQDRRPAKSETYFAFNSWRRHPRTQILESMAPRTVRIAIVGGGYVREEPARADSCRISGIVAAIEIRKKLGIESFTIYEKTVATASSAPPFGGTWQQNVVSPPSGPGSDPVSPSPSSHC